MVTLHYVLGTLRSRAAKAIGFIDTIIRFLTATVALQIELLAVFYWISRCLTELLTASYFYINKGFFVSLLAGLISF